MKKVLTAALLFLVGGAAFAQTNQYYGIKTQSQIYQNSLGHIVFVDQSTGPISLATLANPPAPPSPITVYPATATVSFPFGQITSSITASNEFVTNTSHFKFSPAVDAANAINFAAADGTSILSFATAQHRVGILTTSPPQPLSVNGNVEIAGQLAMGVNTPSGACLIDMVNPFVGLGIPAMTTAQKTAISPNRAGNMVYDTDLGKLCINTGAAWETVTSM